MTTGVNLGKVAIAGLDASRDRTLKTVAGGRHRHHPRHGGPHGGRLDAGRRRRAIPSSTWRRHTRGPGNTWFGSRHTIPAAK